MYPVRTQVIRTNAVFQDEELGLGRRSKAQMAAANRARIQAYTNLKNIIRPAIDRMRAKKLPIITNVVRNAMKIYPDIERRYEKLKAMKDQASDEQRKRCFSRSVNDHRHCKVTVDTVKSWAEWDSILKEYERDLAAAKLRLMMNVPYKGKVIEPYITGGDLRYKVKGIGEAQTLDEAKALIDNKIASEQQAEAKKWQAEAVAADKAAAEHAKAQAEEARIAAEAAKVQPVATPAATVTAPPPEAEPEKKGGMKTLLLVGGAAAAGMLLMKGGGG